MEITIQKIIYPGRSLGLSESKNILTDEGLPGEIVEIIPLKEKKNYIEARTVKIIKPSVSRITPACSHYQACVAYQYMNYETQLAVKKSQLKEIFPDTLINATPSPEIWGYRNKIKLAVLWKDGAAGLAYHVPESRDKFIQIEPCCLASENVNKFLASFIEIVNKENLTSIKEIEVKESYAAKKLMFTTKPFIKIEKIQNNPYIEETVLGKTFRIGPDSFFQINVPMIEEALKEMQKYAGRDKKETIADLYCGIGTFGICLSQYAKEVIGIESAPGNISFLKSNLKIGRAHV